MSDIVSRADIEQLVDTFYKQVINDDTIGIFFTKVVQLDWEVHIPVMYDFWETILLDRTSYKGNPIHKHVQLNKQKTLEPKHFERWLMLWEKSVHDCFKGPNADEAINRARQIAGLMKFKVESSI